MEELRLIAMASYQASSERVQRLARNFFSAMDHDGDGSIDQREFLEFMRGEGHSRMTNTSFFTQLDLDKNGTLDFTEVMMVYYIIQSGRPFCDFCDRFITSTYLTCVGCLEDPNAQPYYLCLKCYAERFYHRHNNSSRFVDNYSLLEYMTKSKLCELRSRPNASLVVRRNPNAAVNRSPPVQNPHTVYNYTSIQNYYFNGCNSSPLHVQQRPSATNALINTANALINTEPEPEPQPEQEKWKIALDVLNAGLYTSLVSASFCTIS